MVCLLNSLSPSLSLSPVFFPPSIYTTEWKPTFQGRIFLPCVAKDMIISLIFFAVSFLKGFQYSQRKSKWVQSVFLFTSWLHYASLTGC